MPQIKVAFSSTHKFDEHLDYEKTKTAILAVALSYQQIFWLTTKDLCRQ